MDEKGLFGGNPLGIILRLVVLSIIVGIVLAALGLQPRDLVQHVQLLIRRIADLGFGAIEGAFGYFLAGAVVVIPIWLVARLIRGLRQRHDDRRS